jgi:hypothetical protein
MSARALISTAFFSVLLNANAQFSRVAIGSLHEFEYNRFAATISPVLYHDISGSPYLYDHFTLGSVILKDSTAFTVPLRYNINSQELEFIAGYDTMVFLKPFELSEFQTSNRRFIYQFLIEREYGRAYISASYFELLCEGNYTLLKKYGNNLKTNAYEINPLYGGTGRVSSSYRNNYRFYYTEGPGTAARPLPRNRRAILRSFPQGKRELLKEYIKEQRLSMLYEADIRAVFDYYNQLACY